MLIPLTRKKFEDLVPLVPTGPQYGYYWGKPPDFLRRLLIAVVGVCAVVLISTFLGEGFGTLRFIGGLLVGLYWLWSPVYQAALRNFSYRKYQYSGFWQGRVLDVFVTEELIGKEETVNETGELVIVENRERRLNLEVGDDSGFSTRVQVPLKRGHQEIAPGQMAEMVVMSNRPDLSRIAQVSDIYIPSRDVWVSDYACLRQDIFVEVSNQLNAGGGVGRRSRNTSKRRRSEFEDGRFSESNRQFDDQTVSRESRRRSRRTDDVDQAPPRLRKEDDDYPREPRRSKNRGNSRRSSRRSSANDSDW